MIFLIMSSFNCPIYGQFLDSDVVLTVNGLSDDFTKKFKEHKSNLIASLNNAGLPPEIKPIKVEVNYKNGIGYVRMTVNFDVKSIYGESSHYKNHESLFNSFGKGISFLFHNQLFSCLSEYKFVVAKDNNFVKIDLANFESILTLKKLSGDIMNIYGYNELGNGYQVPLYPHYFYSNIQMKISGKLYSTECANINSLNELKMFYLKDIFGLDGKKDVGVIYFCKFYNIPLD